MRLQDWYYFHKFARVNYENMKHVHIELVGREIQPVYTMLNQIIPDKVIYICSKETVDKVKMIEAHTRKLPLESKYVKLEPHNLNSTNEYIDSLYEELDDDDILSLNLVGGTKFWSLAFYKRFADRPNTHFFLISQHDTLWNLSNCTSNPVSSIDLDTILSLQGQTVKSYNLLSEYTDEDDETLKKIECIRQSNFSSFNRLAAVLSNDKKIALENDPDGKFNDGANSVEWHQPDRVTFTIDGTVTELNSPNALSLTFNSGWFEYKVAKLIEGWSKCNDIRLNSIFISKSGDVKNEIDIIIETDYKPVFIECKTQIKNHTDLDKFSTVVKNFSGKGGKAVFISDAPLKESAKAKCRESGITYFCLQQHSKNLQEDLWAFLDKVITKINA